MAGRSERGRISMPEDASRRSAREHDAVERLQLLAETSSWLAAWLLLPVWLGLAGAAVSDFVTFAIGAGLLLSLGVAADRAKAFTDLRHFCWFAAISCLAVLVVGGAVFAITTALR